LVKRKNPPECASQRGVAGVVLSDQVKSFDWKIRNAEFCDKLSEAVVLEIFKKLETLLNFDG